MRVISLIILIFIGQYIYASEWLQKFKTFTKDCINNDCLYYESFNDSISTLNRESLYDEFSIQIENLCINTEQANWEIATVIYNELYSEIKKKADNNSLYLESYLEAYISLLRVYNNAHIEDSTYIDLWIQVCKEYKYTLSRNINPNPEKDYRLVNLYLIYPYIVKGNWIELRNIYIETQPVWDNFDDEKRSNEEIVLKTFIQHLLNYASEKATDDLFSNILIEVSEDYRYLLKNKNNTNIEDHVYINYYLINAYIVKEDWVGLNKFYEETLTICKHSDDSNRSIEEALLSFLYKSIGDIITDNITNKTLIHLYIDILENSKNLIETKYGKNKNYLEINKQLSYAYTYAGDLKNATVSYSKVINQINRLNESKSNISSDYYLWFLLTLDESIEDDFIISNFNTYLDAIIKRKTIPNYDLLIEITPLLLDLDLPSLFKIIIKYQKIMLYNKESDYLTQVYYNSVCILIKKIDSNIYLINDSIKQHAEEILVFSEKHLKRNKLTNTEYHAIFLLYKFYLEYRELPRTQLKDYLQQALTMLQNNSLKCKDSYVYSYILQSLFLIETTMNGEEAVIKEIYNEIISMCELSLLDKYNISSIYYEKIGNLSIAKDNAIKHLDIIHQIKNENKVLDPILEYSAYINLSRITYSLGEIYQAQEYLKIAENLSNTNIFNYIIKNNTALIYQQLGYLDKAIDIYETEINNLIGVLGDDIFDDFFKLYINYSIAIYERDKVKAVKYAEKALEIAEFYSGFGSDDYITGLINLLDLYRGNNQREKYKILLPKTLDLVEGTKYATIFYQLHGDFLFDEGNFKEARTFFALALESSNEKGSRDTFHSLLYTDFIQKQVDSNISNRFFQKSFEKIKEELKQNLISLTSKDREYYVNKRSNYQTTSYLAYNYASLYPNDELNTLAYNFSLLSKNIILRSDVLFRRAIYQSENDTIKKLFDELSLLYKVSNNNELRLGYDQKYNVEVVNNRINEIERTLQASNKEYASLLNDVFIDVEEVKQNLSNDEIAIEFVSYTKLESEWIGKTQYAALVLRKTDSSPCFVPLFEESELSNILNEKLSNEKQRINSLYTKSNVGRLHGDKLYQLIWAPLEEYLEGINTIYYSPIGLLNTISFSAIPLDTGFLIDSFTLRHVLTTGDISNIKNSNRNIDSTNNAVLFGGIDYDSNLIQSSDSHQGVSKKDYVVITTTNDSLRSGWGFLQGTRDEVVAIEHILKNQNIQTTVYTDQDACESVLKSNLLPSPTILHIATHGFFIQDNRELAKIDYFKQALRGDTSKIINSLLRSGLLFSGANQAWKKGVLHNDVEDGILTAAEVSSLNLSNTKLVVLSACESGLGLISNNEDGVYGLQRSFKIANAGSLLMSLWKIDDVITAEFMSDFYKNLLSNLSIHDSYKLTQQNIKNKYKNPYYWAPFILVE